MRRQRTTYYIVGVSILLILSVLALARGGLRRSGSIVLPSVQTDTGNAGENDAAEGLDVVQITPATVQPAINTLSRPATYSRTQRVETYWSGGSGTAYVNSYVRNGAVRMDTVLPDGQWRHILRDGGQTYIWYNSDTADVYQAPTGSFSVDDELWVPTYEDLLEVAPERLAEAGYETYLETDCIYAATAEDGDGYAERYWIAVDSGLLVAAERLQNGQTVYLMEASDTTVSEPSPELFTLPDGTALSAAAD